MRGSICDAKVVFVGVFRDFLSIKNSASYNNVCLQLISYHHICFIFLSRFVVAGVLVHVRFSCFRYFHFVHDLTTFL